MSLTLFYQFENDLNAKIHNMTSDTFKSCLVTNATVPTASTAAPHVGGTGTTNFASNKLSGGGYVDVTHSITADSGVDATFSFKLDDAVFAKTSGVSGSAYYLILWNDTDTNKRAIGFVDLSGPLDLDAGSITVAWNASGVYTLS